MSIEMYILVSIAIAALVASMATFTWETL